MNAPANQSVARQYLEPMPARVREVDGAPVATLIHLPRTCLAGVCPVRHSALFDTAKDGVEFRLAHGEGEVLRADGALFDGGEVECKPVVQGDGEEVTHGDGGSQAQELGEEGRRFGLVPNGHDRVVKLHRHVFLHLKASVAHPTRLPTVTPPTPIAELLRRLATLREEEVHVLRALAKLADQRKDAPTHYSQSDGQRPPGCGKRKYLYLHRLAVRAGDKGAWHEGRARIMTPECWTRLATTSPPVQKQPETSEIEKDLELCIQLGATPPNPTAEERAMMLAMNFDQRLAESRAAETARRAREDAANAKRTATKRARYGPSLRRKP